MRTALSLCLLASLGACASPSSRIADELGRFGLDPTRAQCIGDRLERDLSVAQLQELARAAKAYGANDTSPGQLTVSDLSRVATSIRDPAVPVAMLRAGSGCGVTASDLLR